MNENSDDLDSLNNLESFYAYQLGEVTDGCKQKLIQEIIVLIEKLKILAVELKSMKSRILRS